MRNAIHRGTVDLDYASSGRSVWQRLLARVGLAGYAGPKSASVDAFEDVVYHLRDWPHEVPDFGRVAADQNLTKPDPFPKAMVKDPLIAERPLRRSL